MVSVSSLLSVATVCSPLIKTLDFFLQNIMIRRELAKLKYALVIFLSCLLVYFVRKDAKIWREILMRDSKIFEENGNLINKDNLFRINILFSVFFSTESILKLVTHTPQYFFKKLDIFEYVNFKKMSKIFFKSFLKLNFENLIHSLIKLIVKKRSSF